MVYLPMQPNFHDMCVFDACLVQLCGKLHVTEAYTDYSGLCGVFICV